MASYNASSSISVTTKVLISSIDILRAGTSEDSRDIKPFLF